MQSLTRSPSFEAFFLFFFSLMTGHMHREVQWRVGQKKKKKKEAKEQLLDSPLVRPARFVDDTREPLT